MHFTSKELNLALLPFWLLLPLAQSITALVFNQQPHRDSTLGLVPFLNFPKVLSFSHLLTESCEFC